MVLTPIGKYRGRLADIDTGILGAHKPIRPCGALLIDDGEAADLVVLRRRRTGRECTGRIARCLKIIGVYEPLRVMQADGTELTGSALTLAEQFEAPGSVALYTRCYDVFEQGGGQGRAAAPGRAAVV